MHLLSEIKSIINPSTLVHLGYLAITLIIFAESGLFFGFFLPGDSLLILAGVAAATGYYKIGVLILLIFVAAFLGDQLGYWLGRLYGRKLFSRQDSLLFKKQYVTDSEAFFAKYGRKTIILARFMPVIRTFTPVLAGIGQMDYPIYLVFDLIGAALWGAGVTYVGYLLGTKIPHLDKYITYIVIAIIVVSLLPVINHLAKNAKKQA